MSDNCISEIAFNTLPNAIRDWLKSVGWEREDITSVHIQYSNPAIFTFTNNKQEKKVVSLRILSDGKWADRIEQQEKV